MVFRSFFLLSASARTCLHGRTRWVLCPSELTASASESTTSTTSKERAKPTSNTKLEIIPISLKTTQLGTKAPSAAELARIRSRLAAFDTSDRNRVLREEALNEGMDLEQCIQHAFCTFHSRVWMHRFPFALR